MNTEREHLWGHSRPFNAFANYCVAKFGERIQKVAINAGFTCPNRDGTISFDGCYYCNNQAFNPSYCDSTKSVSTQLEEGIVFLSNRYKKANKFLAYFQAYTNTHAHIKELKAMYEEALAFPHVIGIVVGTRPDSMSEEILDYLSEVALRKFVSVEYGIETTNNKALEFVNRGHTFEQAANAIHLTAQRGIHVGVHLIFGLPGDTKELMWQQADVISKLPINTIKMHQLQIVKDTILEKIFIETPQLFNFFTLEEYIDFVIKFVEKLNPNIVIDRFAGEVPPRFLAGPTIMKKAHWGYIRNDQILQMIEKEMINRKTWQGRLYTIF